jgi:hypothetical protein
LDPPQVNPNSIYLTPKKRKTNPTKGKKRKKEKKKEKKRKGLNDDSSTHSSHIPATNLTQSIYKLTHNPFIILPN